jgi:ABC-type polysaccharide/polyol phosphate export permease
MRVRLFELSLEAKESAKGLSLCLAFKDIAFNLFKAGLKFSILLQPVFYAHNRDAESLTQYLVYNPFSQFLPTIAY